MANKRKNWYLTSDQIYQEWVKWRDSNEDVSNRVISDGLAMMMYSVADHLLTHDRFSRYPAAMKDDMRQEAVLKIMKNLKNMKEDYKASFFNYFTRCAWTAFVVYLRNHYKSINLKRELYLNAMEEAMLSFGENPSMLNVANAIKMRLDDLDNEEKEQEV